MQSLYSRYDMSHATERVRLAYKRYTTGDAQCKRNWYEHQLVGRTTGTTRAIEKTRKCARIT
eukprot:9079055-Pyramimonas_sp.AAC.1